MESGGGRIEYLDFLRAGAAVAVVLYHVRAWGAPGMLVDWLFNWCVPMFLLITGALFFRDDLPVTIERIWKKNISKILLIILFWGLTYNITYSLFIEKTFNLKILLRALETTLLFPAYSYANHFWYLYVLVGLYAFLPLAKSLQRNVN